MGKRPSVLVTKKVTKVSLFCNAVATVNTSSGKVKGVKKGTVTIICYAQNGVYKVVKVTVK